ncbi:hypothetical protein D3C80_1667030 [compost metagenome]
MRGHQQHRQLRLLAAQLRQQLVPIHTRHVDVTDHQAERFAQHSLQCLFGAAHGAVGETADFQGIAERLA